MSQRMTKQRELIMTCLDKDNVHLTADEIYTKVREKLPRISLGTVYRNLDLMAEAGAINIIGSAGAKKKYDGNVTRHYHLTCDLCGHMEDVELTPASEIEEWVKKDRSFKIMDYRLEFTGLCSECRLKSESKSEEW